MANASRWLEIATLNHFFRNTSVTSPAQTFLALYTSDPTEFDTGMEISGGGYVRQQITWGTPSQVAGISTISNNNAIAFPEATSDWTSAGEKITHWGIRTAVTGGNLLAYGEFTDPTSINDGKYDVTVNDQFNVGIGRINLQFKNRASLWLQSAALNHFFRSVPVPSPQEVYLALYRTDPTPENIGAEISYQGYSRQLITFDQPLQTSATAEIRNSQTINFPINNVETPPIVSFGIHTDMTGGELVAFGSWNIGRSLLAGMQFSVGDGGLEISMD